jgi:hypothetical protein
MFLIANNARSATNRVEFVPAIFFGQESSRSFKLYQHSELNSVWKCSNFYNFARSRTGVKFSGVIGTPALKACKELLDSSFAAHE